MYGFNFIKPDIKYNIDNYQPAIDTQKDYEFFTNIYDKFYKESEIIDLAEVVRYLNNDLEKVTIKEYPVIAELKKIAPLE